MKQLGAPPAPLLRPTQLEAALHRPRNHALYDSEADVVSQAVVLAVAISQAQAFLDGNKRTALIATDTFLTLNGYRRDASSDIFACWLICVAGNISDYDLDLVIDQMGVELAAELDALGRKEVTERFEEWLRQNVSTVGPGELTSESDEIL